jgi:hypothetical protein
MAKRVRPQRGDGVAVEVPHQRVKVTEVVPMAELARVGRFQGVVARKLVHQAPVPRSLLGGVVVVLVARVRLATIDPERVGGVRIVHQQGLGEPVHRRRARTRPERRLPGWVGRHGIGAEVGVERVVLLEDHDHVLDPCSRRDGARSGRGWPLSSIRSTPAAIIGPILREVIMGGHDAAGTRSSSTGALLATPSQVAKPSRLRLSPRYQSRSVVARRKAVRVLVCVRRSGRQASAPDAGAAAS